MRRCSIARIFGFTLPQSCSLPSRKQFGKPELKFQRILLCQFLVVGTSELASDWSHGFPRVVLIRQSHQYRMSESSFEDLVNSLLALSVVHFEPWWFCHLSHDSSKSGVDRHFGQHRLFAVQQESGYAIKKPPRLRMLKAEAWRLCWCRFYRTEFFAPLGAVTVTWRRAQGLPLGRTCPLADASGLG